MSISETWGTNANERQLSFACDALIKTPDAQLYRGITINASAKVVFRWLCQLRVAPYSYDWIDNGGRQSPPELTPGLEQLEIGQDVMAIFTLSEFAHDKHLTIRIKPKRSGRMLCGDIAVTYLIVPTSDFGRNDRNSCRLLVKLVVRCPRSLKGRLMSKLLPWGDLFMMRRQLLNLRQLALRTSSLQK